MRPNELWQTDVTYLKVLGWGWFYLSTILDDDSRYIIAWKLCTTMKAEDVTDTLDMALDVSGCDSATVVAKPRLLSERAIEGGCRWLRHWFEKSPATVRAQWRVAHLTSRVIWPIILRTRAWTMSAAHLTTRRPKARPSPSRQFASQSPAGQWVAPDHEPKVREANNRVLLEHYVLPGDLERQIGAFVEYYNTRRYHESLGNLTPADVYFGRGEQILKQREEIKRKTMLTRRLRNETENS